MDTFLGDIEPDVFNVYTVEELNDLHSINTLQAPVQSTQQVTHPNTIRNIARRVSNQEYTDRINQAYRYGFPKLTDDGRGNVHDHDYYDRRRYLSDYHRDKLKEIQKIVKIPVKKRINKTESRGSMVDKMTPEKIAELRNDLRS